MMFDRLRAAPPIPLIYDGVRGVWDHSAASHRHHNRTPGADSALRHDPSAVLRGRLRDQSVDGHHQPRRQRRRDSSVAAGIRLGIISGDRASRNVVRQSFEAACGSADVAALCHRFHLTPISRNFGAPLSPPSPMCRQLMSVRANPTNHGEADSLLRVTGRK